MDLDETVYLGGWYVCVSTIWWISSILRVWIPVKQSWDVYNLVRYTAAEFDIGL